MIALVGCSGANKSTQQAEIVKLRTEANKAKAEASALNRQNDVSEGDTAQLQAKVARDRAATAAMDVARKRAEAE